ncbi:histidine acid phosphatase, partial [Colletotrichum asianum]
MSLLIFPRLKSGITFGSLPASDPNQPSKTLTPCCGICRMEACSVISSQGLFIGMARQYGMLEPKKFMGIGRNMRRRDSASF